MTGYGRGEATLNGRAIVIELRSVNNRYLDCSVRLPRSCAFCGGGIKSRIKEATSRGKVDVFVTVDSTQADAVAVQLNRPLAESYMKAFAEMSETFQITNDVTTSVLARFPDVLTVEKLPQDQDALQADLNAVLDLALADYDHMRSAEGVSWKKIC